MSEAVQKQSHEWVMTDVADLRANPANPKRHPDKQVALLAKIIRKMGWRHPVIVSRRSGLVVAGHARIEAARLLGWSEVPVDYQEFRDEAEEVAFLLADNRIAELAETDEDALRAAFGRVGEIGGLDFDMDLTGFDVVSRAEVGQVMAGPWGETSTDRSGQGVGSTWESCQKTNAAPVRVGPWESRLSLDVAKQLVERCEQRYEQDGVPMHETLLEVVTCGLRS